MATTTKPDLSVTTTDHLNVGRLRAAFDAFSRGDLDAVRDSMTPDAVWTNAGSSAVGGTFEGWDAISTMFGKLFVATDGTFTITLLSALADDKHAVAVSAAPATIMGDSQTHRYVLVDDMTPDGRTRATHVLAYDQAAADAFMPR
jgi:ketosteroid isomerase-like protein